MYETIISPATRFIAKETQKYENKESKCLEE